MKVWITIASGVLLDLITSDNKAPYKWLGPCAFMGAHALD